MRYGKKSFSRSRRSRSRRRGRRGKSRTRLISRGGIRL